MMPETKIEELLMKWVNEAGLPKDVRFTRRCSPPGPAPSDTVGDKWGVDLSEVDKVIICRLMGKAVVTETVPSPFSISWNDPPWTDDQKVAFIVHVSEAIERLRIRG